MYFGVDFMVKLSNRWEISVLAIGGIFHSYDTVTREILLKAEKFQFINSVDK